MVVCTSDFNTLNFFIRDLQDVRVGVISKCLIDIIIMLEGIKQKLTSELVSFHFPISKLPMLKYVLCGVRHLCLILTLSSKANRSDLKQYKKGCD